MDRWKNGGEKERKDEALLKVSVNRGFRKSSSTHQIQVRVTSFSGSSEEQHDPESFKDSHTNMFRSAQLTLVSVCYLQRPWVLINGSFTSCCSDCNYEQPSGNKRFLSGKSGSNDISHLYRSKQTAAKPPSLAVTLKSNKKWTLIESIQLICLYLLSLVNKLPQTCNTPNTFWHPMYQVRIIWTTSSFLYLVQ